MKYRPLLPRSFNAPTIYGRARLRNLADSHRSLMSRIVELEAHLYLLAVQQQAAPPATAPKSTTSRASQPSNPQMFDTQWSEGTLSFLSSDPE